MAVRGRPLDLMASYGRPSVQKPTPAIGKACRPTLTMPHSSMPFYCNLVKWGTRFNVVPDLVNHSIRNGQSYRTSKSIFINRKKWLKHQTYTGDHVYFWHRRVAAKDVFDCSIASVWLWIPSACFQMYTSLRYTSLKDWFLSSKPGRSRQVWLTKLKK